MCVANVQYKNVYPYSTVLAIPVQDWHRKCRWGRTIREHVRGRLQLHLSSSAKPPDCAVAALTELFTADRWSERNDTLLNAPLTLTFGTVSELKKWR